MPMQAPNFASTSSFTIQRLPVLPSMRAGCGSAAACARGSRLVGVRCLPGPGDRQHLRSRRGGRSQRRYRAVPAGEGGALGRPVRCAVCRQLDRSLPARQFSIFVCVAGDDTKAQDVLKPFDGLLEVTHANLDPACFGHFSAPIRRGLPPREAALDLHHLRSWRYCRTRKP